MKVGIITFNSAHNYGAMLQAYALQTFVENMGFEVEIINYRLNVIDRVYNPFRRSKKGNLDFGYYKQRTKLYLKEQYKLEKFKRFESFLNEFLNVTVPYKTVKELYDANFDYEFFICGSDQIWNPEITKGLKPEYFLDFAPETSIKVSYAASIGKDEIDDFNLEVLNHYISNLDSISIREQASLDCLSKASDENMTITVDPTLLIDKKDYDNIKNDLHFKDKEYIFVYTLEHNEELLKIAEKISKIEKIPIIFNRPQKLFENQLESIPYIGPREFLGVISNAKYVITNSYHGTIFSIIYNKKFVAMPNTNTPTRIFELINKLDLGQTLFHSFNEFKSIKNIEIDYKDVYKRIQEIKKESKEFLEKSLDANIKKPNIKCYFESEDKFTCYGCYACESKCLQNAISMIEDNEGFFYPFINKELCNNCNECKNICIYRRNDLLERNKNFPKVYATINKNSKIRMLSSSGGMFLPIAEKTIENEGYVVAVGYDDEFNVKHKIANTYEKCKEFTGSKYVRSDIRGIFPKIKSLLEDYELVLFVGLPCQVAGLKAYLTNEYDNLFLAELICHSSPSPKIFKQYVEFLEKKERSKIVNFNFRDKKLLGWNRFSVIIEFENGKIINEDARTNDYTRGFLSGLTSRKCCYSCEFIGENRVGDITLGDFWGIEDVEPDFNDNKGTSMIIVNNKKGESLFESIKDKLIFSPSDMNIAFKKNHKHPIPFSEKRVRFFSRLDNEPIEKILFSYNHTKKRQLKQKTMKYQRAKKFAKRARLNKMYRYIRNLKK